MYEYLEGEIATRGATRLVLDVGGVGYDIAVPLGARFDVIAGKTGAGAHDDSAGRDRVHVWTHFIVRETAQLLFGFPTTGMRGLFRLLLQVRGVGPQLALAVLSSLSDGELLEAIAAGDSAPLRRIKGVGKKTAEQILLDLQDRAPQHPPAATEHGVLTPAGSRRQVIADAVTALISIGYTEKQAEISVQKASQKNPTEELEALVRAALRE